MKKGQIVEGIINKVEFPNKCHVYIPGERDLVVKNGIRGQKVSVRVTKMRKGKAEGDIKEIIEKSPLELDMPSCKHFGECGGCTYQNIPYDTQLKLKEEQVKALIAPVIKADRHCGGANECGVDNCPVGMQAVEDVWGGIKGSPRQFEYRNKMEFSFGDLYKDGPLSLGMHKRGSFYDIVEVNECQIVEEDFRKILIATLDFFRQCEAKYYHKIRHEGYLRHLLVRKGIKTGEILVDLVTTSVLDEEVLKHYESEEQMLEAYRDTLVGINFDGQLMGVLHTKNDNVADTVKDEGTAILMGQDFFYEELLGLKFKISPFSFFQTNSLGAEVLYETAREYCGDLENLVGENKKPVIFDLYSGTGTIAQILSPVAEKVIGVEIVEEAVEAAKVNAELNGLTNCEFIADDVLKALDNIKEKPDFIMLDPPREGVHPKALEKIIAYGVERMVYISCKPTSLARDLEVLQARGYEIKKISCVDMFPGTAHVETVALLSRVDS